MSDAYTSIARPHTEDKVGTTEYVHVEGVGMTFHTKRGPFVAIRDIDLSVQKGEFIALIGHSGCGKSTLLNLVAGLIQPTAGVLLCAGREIAGPGPDRGVVFQNHSLLPWLTCFDNVHLVFFRVSAATETKSELKRRTHEALALVGLTHAEHKLPQEVSGGMKQRVGIARALAMQPKVLLLDEPFGALDARVRKELRAWLRQLHEKVHVTSVFVTHDQDEALELADRIVVMNEGRIEQVASAEELRRSPGTPFVSEFLQCAA
ncbi:MAG: ABC transporter ATP-binding protein [Lysobacterales bacterium]|nr:MAG: ABC transporter ATP-binding protein [Xanthomonadales bacterium]